MLIFMIAGGVLIWMALDGDPAGYWGYARDYKEKVRNKMAEVRDRVYVFPAT